MEFAKENAHRNLGDPKVHLSFVLDTSGIVSLLKAEATYDLPPPPPEELSAEETMVEATEMNTTEGVSGNATGDGADGATDGSANPSKKNGKKDSKKKVSKKSKPEDLVLRRTLKIVENVDQVKPHTWTPSMIAESRSKLAILAAKDEERKANEGMVPRLILNCYFTLTAALNDLEAYIYKVKNTFAEEEDGISSVSTEVIDSYDFYAFGELIVLGATQ